MAAGEEAATVFLKTSLGTGLAVSFPASGTTVQDLKRRVSEEHAATFPRIGNITVQSFKVRRRGSWYRLTDSMAVRAAFHGIKGAWHLRAHVLPHSAAAAAAAHEDAGRGGTHNKELCAQHNAINAPLLPAASQGGALSDIPSTDQEDEQGHPDPGVASALAPPVTARTSVDKRKNVEGTVRGENSDPDAASEDGDRPARGQRRAGVIKDLRGRKHLREEDGDRDRDQSVLADLVSSIRQDDQNRCTHSSMPKRVCTAREDGPFDGVGANSIGGSCDVVAISSDDEMLEDDEGLDFLETKEEETVSTRTTDQAEKPVEESCDHETMSITNDKGSKLCFSVKQNDSISDTGNHADEGMALEKLVEQQDHVDNGEESNSENAAPCFSVNKNDSATAKEDHTDGGMAHEKQVEQQDHLDNCKDSNSENPAPYFSVNKNDSTAATEENADGGMAHEKLVEQQDHSDNGEESNSENPAPCFSVNKNDSTTATEEHADGGMAHEKLVEQQGHRDNAAEALQNCNSKDSSVIHPVYVSDCHQYEGSSRSFDLKCCKKSGCEILADQVGDHDRVCSEVERAASEKRDRSTKICDSVSATVGGCFDIFTPAPNLEFSEQRVNSTEQYYHRSDSVLEPSIDEMCNSANSKKRADLPPCVETLKEDNSSEKQAMAHDVKGKRPWKGKVCNGERSSKSETDLPPCVVALKEVNYSEKEKMTHKVEEKDPWTARVSNGEISSNGTDLPPCAGSIKEGNSSEKEGVAPTEEKKSTRTVTLVDVDGTKWEVELDDSYQIGRQESSSSHAEESYSNLAKPRENAEECLPQHSSFKIPTSNDPTGSKGVEGTSADGAEQGAWDGRRRPRHVVRKMPNSRAAKMYGSR